MPDNIIEPDMRILDGQADAQACSLIPRSGQNHHPWASRGYQDGIRCDRVSCIHHGGLGSDEIGRCGDMSFCQITAGGCTGFKVTEVTKPATSE
jgi:hypothetical protein